MDYNAIQVGRFDAAARKLLGIKNSQVLPVLAAELSAQLNLDPNYGEGQVVAGWLPFGADCTATAVAAQFGAVILTNPWPNSIMEITRLRVNATANAALTWGVSATPGAVLTLTGVDQNPVNGYSRDTRRGTQAQVIGRVGTMAAIGGGAVIGRGNAPTLPNPGTFELDVMLHYDARGMTTIGQLIITTQTANQLVNFNIEGRIRLLDPAEVWPAS